MYASFDQFETTSLWYEWHFNPSMTVAYNVDRPYIERVTVALSCDTQAMVTDPGDVDTIRLSVAGRADEVVPTVGSGSAPASAGATVTLLDKRSARFYLATPRGQQSLEYLLMLARARLVARARAINVVFEVPFEDGLNATLRHSASISDSRLPGGTATGKITGIRWRADGDSGEVRATIQMGCTVGTSGSVSPAAGSPSYGDSYVETGYQVYTGAQAQPSTSDVVYNLPTYSPNDEAIEFDTMTADDIVVSWTVYNDAKQQRHKNGKTGPFSTSFTAAKQTIEDKLKVFYTECELDLIDLKAGPVETDIAITTGNLQIIKTIDLEAT